VAGHFTELGRSKQRELVLTDYLMLFSVALALFFALRPELPVTENWLRHTPLAALFLPLLLTSVGGALFSPARPERPAWLWATLWPLLLLAGTIVAGGLYARFQHGEQNSFLTVGLYMLIVLPVSALLLLRTASVNSILTIYFTSLTLLFVAVLVTGMVAFERGEELYHEIEFMVIPLALVFVLRGATRAQRCLALFACLGAAYVIHKNTAYLVALLTLTYLCTTVWLPAVADRSRRAKTMAPYMLIATLSLALAAVAVLAVAYIVQNRGSYLPTGNPEFRLHTYAMAWNRFLASPLWGSLFSESASNRFTLFRVGASTQVLPTHSDTLDILANGGVASLGLLLYGVCRLAAFAWRNLLAPRFAAGAWWAYGHTLACMSLAALVTCSLNPILLQPGKAFFVWANAGWLLALAILNARNATQAPGPSMPSGNLQ
jgi:hypothetical protein